MDSKVRDHKINELWESGYSILEAENIVDNGLEVKTDNLSGEKVVDILKRISRQKESERKAQLSQDLYQTEEGKFYYKDGKTTVRR